MASDGRMAQPETVEMAKEHGTITRDELLARLQDARLAIVYVLPKEAFQDGHQIQALARHIV